jgi:hypothetical protein
MNLILLVILVFLLLAALPAWPYSAGWGYYPSGALGLVLVVVLVMALMGRVQQWTGGDSPSRLESPRYLDSILSSCDRSLPGRHL